MIEKIKDIRSTILGIGYIIKPKRLKKLIKKDLFELDNSDPPTTKSYALDNF